MQAQLDKVLINFGKDVWTVRDACEGTSIMGSTGAGKTTGSGALIASAMLDWGFGGLVMCAKPEEVQLWQKYAAAANRSRDLIVIEPGSKWRFNFLDYELRRAGPGAGNTENIVNLLTVVTEIAEGHVSQTDRDPFWSRAAREMLRNAVDVLALSKRKMTLEAIHDIISSAAQSVEQLNDVKWKEKSENYKAVGAALANATTAREKHDAEMARKYWLAYPALNDRTRTSIVATFTSMADLLLHGAVWEMLCTDTTIVPEVAYKTGAIIVLNLPVQEYGELGRLVQGIFKYCYQKAITRRNPATDARPVFLWADEAQNFVSSFDYQFQAVARSARAATVYLTQSISNYYSVLRNHDEAHALMGNLGTKIFHSNTDVATNKYASDVIAEERTINFTFNSSDNRYGGGSQAVRNKVIPADFVSLKKGGPANQNKVEAIIIQSGRVWRTSGDTWMKTIFKQV